MNSIKIETVELKEMTPLELAKQLLAFWDLSGRPDDGQMYADMESVAQALIRREEGVEVKRYSPGSWQCVVCKSLFSNAPNYCDDCGARLQWPSPD